MEKIKLFSFLLLTLASGIISAKAKEIEANYKLADDITEQVVVDGRTVTIDLNNYDITANVSSAAALVIKNGANVTVIGEGTIKNALYNGVIVDKNSTFTLAGGKIEAKEFGVLVGGKSTFTMNGGIIETIDNCGIGGNSSDIDEYKDYTININEGIINSHIERSGYIACGIYHPNRGIVNINGGTINAIGGAGIVQRAGILNITGGTINATGKTTGYVGDSKNTLTSNAVVVDKLANYPEVATLETRISESATLTSEVDDKISTREEDITIEAMPLEPNVHQTIEVEDFKLVIVDKNKVEEYEAVNSVLEKEKLGEKDISLIEQAINGKYTLGAYYKIYIIKAIQEIPPEEESLLEIKSFPTIYEAEIELPSNLPEVKKGFTRKYYVVRLFEGEVTIIDDATISTNGSLTFEIGMFPLSTCALVYNDVQNNEEGKNTENTEKVNNVENKEEVKNVDTYDSIISYIVITIMTSILVFSALLYVKKKLS